MFIADGLADKVEHAQNQQISQNRHEKRDTVAHGDDRVALEEFPGEFHTLTGSFLRSACAFWSPSTSEQNPSSNGTVSRSQRTTVPPARMIASSTRVSASPPVAR